MNGPPWWLSSEESACNADVDSILGLGRSPGGGCGNPFQYSCLENPHGQRSLVGYSSWGHKESDTTEQLSTHIHTHRYIHKKMCTQIHTQAYTQIHTHKHACTDTHTYKHTYIHTYIHVWVLSHFSCVQLFEILWTVACQTPLSMRFSR